MINYENEMKLTIRAKSENESFARSAVAAFFTQLNPTVEQVEDVRTAVSEAVTNCIVHGYEGSQTGNIEINCGVAENVLYIEIVDFGKGIENVEKALEPFYTTVTTGERSGMGFTVMRAFCDSLEVTSESGKTSVRLTKKIGDAE